jgi:hypothetical protein
MLEVVHAQTEREVLSMLTPTQRLRLVAELNMLYPWLVTAVGWRLRLKWRIVTAGWFALISESWCTETELQACMPRDVIETRKRGLQKTMYCQEIKFEVCLKRVFACCLAVHVSSAIALSRHASSTLVKPIFCLLV